MNPNSLIAVVCHLFSVCCLLLCIAVLEDEELLLVNAAPMVSSLQSGPSAAAAGGLCSFCLVILFVLNLSRIAYF
jgi:hypothetical protein